MAVSDQVCPNCRTRVELKPDGSCPACKKIVGPPQEALFDFKHGKTRIVIKRDDGAVTFYNCHYSNSFWTLRADRVFTCPLEDILGVYNVGQFGHGRHAKSPETRIVTKHGKTMIFLPKREREATQELEKIREFLSRVGQHTPDAGISQHPVIIPIVGFALAALVIWLIWQILWNDQPCAKTQFGRGTANRRRVSSRLVRSRAISVHGQYTA